MKKYLVINDYGMGATPIYIYANSADEITKLYPELDVITNDISTLKESIRYNIEEYPLQEFNIYDSPKGFLKDLIAARENNSGN